ncbi:hypothetical protein MRX96_004545 [Rhipicephalus microplus]|uniref:Uncharacterized protein n=1 Tax=Rhipicephalus microplus TaxID=6941 RepID=A0A9J6D6Y2_RHIMP|nr:hypothetical protein HPB51_019885 [Rhipicephalus microplus]
MHPRPQVKSSRVRAGFGHVGTVDEGSSQMHGQLQTQPPSSASVVTEAADEVLIKPGELSCKTKGTARLYVEAAPGHFKVTDRAGLENGTGQPNSERVLLRSRGNMTSLQHGWARLGHWAQGLLAGLELWQAVVTLQEGAELDPLVLSTLTYLLGTVALVSTLDRCDFAGTVVEEYRRRAL